MTLQKTRAQNPLLQDWTAPYGLPPFAQINPAHYRPAFAQGMQERLKNVARIAQNPAEPTFENTIEAMELCEIALEKVAAVFYNRTSAHTSAELQEIEREMAPKIAQNNTAVLLNSQLFARIATLFEKHKKLDLTQEQFQLLKRYYKAHKRAGAGLDDEAKHRIGEINQELAALGTQFSQNVQQDEAAFVLPLESAEDTAGLPQFLLDAAAEAARTRDLKAPYVVTLSRSLYEPFLQFSANRTLREKLLTAFTSRGNEKNWAIVSQTLKLRQEKAKLLGYPTYAHYKLEDTMAGTPEAVNDLLAKVWHPARRKALTETAELQAIATTNDADLLVRPHDWRYYSEQNRKARFDLDEAELKPYFTLENMLAAIFKTAQRLFNVTAKERFDLELYHEDCRAFDILDEDGRKIGLFLADLFARPSKRSGAWKSSFQDQHKLGSGAKPIIVNVLNLAKAPEGQQTLLTLDDARTLFHEFGHALHGLLSNVTYPSLSGTKVTRDFVELPSQLLEHWLMTPQILEEFARHAQTGEPMPQSLLAKIKAAETYNQGFQSVEYLATAMVDAALHQNTGPVPDDLQAEQTRILTEIGMPEAIVMRHATPHLLHAFAGDFYASEYYSYLWSEVMDADAFAAFEEAGDPFDGATARSLKDNVFSVGGSVDPKDAYIAFRGALPDATALLRGRGLLELSNTTLD
ncbi:M3 family metallopeptidase [Polycladidibacter hongkongensis]|uniref:M3 family metallopeptidase n=1 Tax=Polycladidibacter hongkongensis TaxID=1647556 RepID=UPI00083758DC|nr:M3 family metallopeptidase [Pseudovibrio hongkongensis]